MKEIRNTFVTGQKLHARIAKYCAENGIIIARFTAILWERYLDSLESAENKNQKTA